MNFSNALLYSLIGIMVVFFALFLIMLLTKLLLLGYKETKTIPIENANPEPMTVKANGSVGEVKLYDTDPKDAAMIMAIVADEMKIPLNELRFISIKEVEQ